jgi:hypothetical protein
MAALAPKQAFDQEIAPNRNEFGFRRLAPRII